MTKFVDLKTGNIFDGSKPYKFWFDGGQSVGLTYSLPICVISDKKELSISLQKNDIFQIIDPNRLENLNSQIIQINNFEYYNIHDLVINEEKITIKGTQHLNYYLYLIYFTANSKTSGEYIELFKIDEEEYLVGADFYEENESLYINLSNRGIDIPESIQKAIYTTDIHEDKRDNILLNRKWKELLSNYWDTIANKGSYKSLINSLKWFEYGDKIRLCQIWKNVSEIGERYESIDLTKTLQQKYIDSFQNFSQTTYLALYYALDAPKYEKDKLKYGPNKNPILEKVSLDWSLQDLVLKMCLLGNFYETFFMPIHLDLFHCTVENIIFSDPIKTTIFGSISRKDHIYEINDVKCNIQNGDIFLLSPVQCYVGPKTFFGNKIYSENIIPVGVQKEIVKEVISKEDDELLKVFTSQFYHGLGAIIDFEITVPLSQNDKIKKSTIVFTTLDDQKNEINKVNTEYKIISSQKLNFSLLCRYKGNYCVRLQFNTIQNHVYTKCIKFEVIDTSGCGIKIFKVQNDQRNHECINNTFNINKYFFNRQLNFNDIKPFIQYINAGQETNNGIKLNHMYILTEEDDSLLEYYFKHPIENKDNNGNPYIIYISKQFNYQPIYHPNNIYDERYIFIPEFHKLIELDSERNSNKENLNFYTVNDEDTLCIIPDLPYGDKIQQYEWEFINVSLPIQNRDRSNIYLSSVKEPFIANDKENTLPPGYYSIIFRYKIGNEIQEIKLDSAFRKI